MERSTVIDSRRVMVSLTQNGGVITCRLVINLRKPHPSCAPSNSFTDPSLVNSAADDDDVDTEEVVEILDRVPTTRGGITEMLYFA